MITTHPPTEPNPLRTPTHYRAISIETHHSTQRALFLRSLVIHTPLNNPTSTTTNPTTTATPIITFPSSTPPHHYTTARTTPLSSLSSTDAHQFLYKDCAMYGAFDMSNAEPLTIFDEVYKLWWPRRDRVADVDPRFWAFGGKFLRFEGGGGVGLGEVVGFQRELVEKLEIAGREGEGRLRESFKECCIVFEREGWRREGVLLVCSDEGVTKRRGVEEGEGVRWEWELEAGEGVRPAVVWRMGLARAMRAVIYGDEGRRERRGKEWNEMFEEKLGSEGEE